MMESNTGHQSFETRLRGSSSGRIRRLSGFQSYHRVPDRIHAGADHFVQSIGQQELSQQVEQLHADLRQLFGYKRRSMSAACDAGQGQLRTPDFQVDLHIQQDPQAAKQYQIVTEVSISAGSEIAKDPVFTAALMRYAIPSILAVHRCSRLQIASIVSKNCQSYSRRSAIRPTFPDWSSYWSKWISPCAASPTALSFN